MKLLKNISLFIIGFYYFINFSHGEESNRIAVIVNKYLKQEIEENLNIYLQDLKNEGYEPILKEWDLENDPAPKTLKFYLKTLYKEQGSLQGAVLIGDLPIPIMEADPSLKNVKYNSGGSNIQISDGYIAERYYMDLIGKEWIENEKNHKFEEPDYQTYWEKFLETIGYYTPETLNKIIANEDLYPIPEIWTSRIMTSSLTGFFKKSEGELVNTYLEKNHTYRTGEIVFQNQALLYAMKGEPSAFPETEFTTIRNILSKNYVLKEPIPSPTTINAFFEPLENESYEIFNWGRHGLKTFIDLGSNYLYSKDLTSTPINIKTSFVFPFSCWIGHYLEPAYFAGSYLFNQRFYALAMSTATLPMYIRDQATSIMSDFINGDNLGLAFMKAIVIPNILEIKIIWSLEHLSSRIASSNSRYILGDGTLKLQPKGLTEEEKNSPQAYLTEKYPLSGELLYNFIKSKGSGAEEFKDSAMVSFLFKTAVELNDYDMFHILVIKNLKAKDEMGNTFLHLAAGIKTNQPMLQSLIGWGLDISTKNNLGQTPWDIAKENGNDIAMFDSAIKLGGTIELIKFLIQNGANIHGQNKDNDNNTPLLTAVKRGDLEIINLLLENGADLNVKNNQRHTPWDIILEKWYLLKDINFVNSLFKHAFEQNYCDILYPLIKRGANLMAQPESGNTYMHLAAVENKDLCVMKILLESGTDMNTKNSIGKTPWDIAKENHNDMRMFDLMIMHGTAEQVKFLIENGADVNGHNKDYDNDTPLHSAVARGDLEIIKLLLENGADVNARNASNQTPLFQAAEIGDPRVAKMLLENGADIHAKTNNGDTALHAAAIGEYMSHIEVAKMLLEQGADLNLKNNYGKSTWDLMDKYNKQEITKWLENKNSNNKSD